MKNYLLRKRFGLAVIVVFALFVAGCNRAPEVQPLVFSAAPWQANEGSTYQLTDLNGLYAGTARYDWTRLQEGQWNMRREINAQGTQEIIVVDMSEEGFRPQQSTLIRINNNGTEKVTAHYDGSEVNLELTTRLNVVTYERISIPSDAREQATVVMLLRALPLAEGYATRLNVFTPVLGTLDRVTVEVVERQQIEALAGTFDTWYVKMTTATSQTEAWVGTDAPYPVVKFIDSRNGGTFDLSEFSPNQ